MAGGESGSLKWTLILGNQAFWSVLREKGSRSAPRMQAVMTLAWVFRIRKPVPSNSFIRDPVRESRRDIARYGGALLAAGLLLSPAIAAASAIGGRSSGNSRADRAADGQC